MLVNDTTTKEFFETLKEFEGYIQNSSSGVEKFENQNWEALHEDNSFIIEAHFFNQTTNESASIRQINGAYKTFKQALNKEDLGKCNIFKSKLENLDVKIAQIWEAQKDEKCENFEVLKPTMQLFAGFVANKGEEK